MKKRCFAGVMILIAIVMFLFLFYHDDATYDELQGTYTSLEEENRYSISFYDDRYEVYETAKLLYEGSYEQKDDYGVLDDSNTYLVLVSQDRFVYQLKDSTIICHFVKTSDASISYRE